MTTTPNIPLLRQTMEHIEKNPEHWNQDNWRCGSGMCFAGWAATLAGHTWATKDPDADNANYLLVDETTGPVEGALFEDEHFNETTMEWVNDGRALVSVDEVATRDLGLTYEQADILFDGANRLDDLREMVDALAAGESINYPED